MLKRKWIAVLAAVLVIVPIIASACTPGGSKGGGGGTYIIGRGGDSVNLDLATATDGESHRVGNAILDRLVGMEGTSTKIIPWLAESWDSPDGKTWTFKIREGVKFTDGTDCDAEAVKFNFDRWRDPNNEYRFGRVFEYYDTEFGETYAIVDTKAVDKYTFQMTLANPSAVVLYKLNIGSFGISSPKAIQEQGDKYGTPAGTVVGSGRFKFVEWVPDDKIVVERNDDWWGWGEGPSLDRVIWRSIPDNSARLAELLAGTVHNADLAQTDMATAEADPNIYSIVNPSMGSGYIAFQQCIEPFDDVKVRWAIAHAINRQALIDTFYTDRDVLATGFQPPAILGHNPDLPPIEYNPDKAKELLAEAGYPDGFQTEFWYIPVIRGYFPDSKALAEAIAVDLAKVGIEVELKTEDWGTYLDHRLQGLFPMWMLGWGSDNGDPDNYIGFHFAQQVPGQANPEDCYNSPELQDLLTQGAQEPDVALREQYYQQAEQIVYDDMARLPVAFYAGQTFYRNEVKGVTPMVFRDQLELIHIEEGD